MASTQQTSPEQQIEQLKQQLAHAQRMISLGELVSTTTHEFNNVLTTIINYAKLGMRHKDDATRDKALTKIHDAGLRAAKITNAVLGAARNRRAGFEPVNLQQIVEESLVLLERELQKYRIDLETSFEEAPEINADGNQIQQVLMNLLINARQAMSGGGRVVIGIHHDKEAGTVDLLVRDTGPGIAADKLQKIFDPFYSTKDGPDETGKGGSGVGLSCCRDIIEAHKGRIRVESTVGVGTAFTLKLPVAA